MAACCWEDQNRFVLFGDRDDADGERQDPGCEQMPTKGFVWDGRTRVVSPLSKHQVQWQIGKKSSCSQ